MKTFIYFLLLISCNQNLVAQAPQWTATNSIDRFDNLALHTKGDTLFASVGGAGIYITTDNGNTWFQKNNGLTNVFIKSFASNKQYIFAGSLSGRDGGLFRSGNNGETWERLASNLPISEAHALSFKGDTLFAGTNTGIYYTTNTGNSWTKAYQLSFDISALFVKDSLILGFGRNPVRRPLYRSADNGATWQEINTSVRHEVSGVALIGKTLFIGTTGDTLHKSEDAGRTWQKIQTPLPSNIRSMISVDFLLIVGGEFNGISISSDTGKTWSRYSEGLPDRRILSLANHKNLLFAGTSGNKIWKNTLNPINTIQKVTPATLQMTLYPNPAAQFATLKYQLNKKAAVTITLSDSNGRVVKHFYKGIQVAGKEEITFQTSDLAAGMYFCTLIIDKQIASIALQIVR